MGASGHGWQFNLGMPAVSAAARSSSTSQGHVFSPGSQWSSGARLLPQLGLTLGRGHGPRPQWRRREQEQLSKWHNVWLGWVQATAERRLRRETLVRLSAVPPAVVTQP